MRRGRVREGKRQGVGEEYTTICKKSDANTVDEREVDVEGAVGSSSWQAGDLDLWRSLTW